MPIAGFPMPIAGAPPDPHSPANAFSFSKSLILFPPAGPEEEAGVMGAEPSDIDHKSSNVAFGFCAAADVVDEAEEVDDIDGVEAIMGLIPLPMNGGCCCCGDCAWNCIGEVVEEREEVYLWPGCCCIPAILMRLDCG